MDVSWMQCLRESWLCTLNKKTTKLPRFFSNNVWILEWCAFTALTEFIHLLFLASSEFLTWNLLSPTTFFHFANVLTRKAKRFIINLVYNTSSSQLVFFSLWMSRGEIIPEKVSSSLRHPMIPKKAIYCFQHFALKVGKG